MQLVLGSTSPYKKQLFEQLGMPFTVANPDINEPAFQLDTVWASVKNITIEKAKALLPNYLGTDTIIVTADVAGEIDGKFLGKPSSREDAIETILSYSGRYMYIWTGTVVAFAKTGEISVDVRKAIIAFNELTREQVENYVDEKKPLDKGGSIAIEEIEERDFVRKIEGERAAIIGLSLEFISSQLPL